MIFNDDCLSFLLWLLLVILEVKATMKCFRSIAEQILYSSVSQMGIERPLHFNWVAYGVLFQGYFFYAFFKCFVSRIDHS
jgi:hypothetical protein